MDTDSIERIIQAYSRFVPHQVFQLMGKASVVDIVLGDSLEKKLTILFSDIRDFTTLSESMTPRQNFDFINAYLERMEPVIDVCRGVIDKYIGDAIMALFPTSADDALDAAVGMLYRLAEYNEERRAEGHPPIAIGIGLNTGLMMLGAIGGGSRMASTVIGDAVNLASRIETLTKTYGVDLLVSEYTYYGLEDPEKYRIRFVDRVRVKGKEQPESVYEVFDADPPARQAAKQRTLRTFERAIARYYLKEVAGARELFLQCLEECPEDRPARFYLDRCTRFMETGRFEGGGVVDLSIAWSPDYAIGVPVIDAQHRQLFESANAFVASVREDRDFSRAARMMDFLDDYVRVHFRTEEGCMEAEGYPFLDFQKDQHARFTALFSALRRDLEANAGADRLFLLVQIQVHVMDWLVHHTSQSDRHFGKYLRLRRAGGEARG